MFVLRWAVDVRVAMGGGFNGLEHGQHRAASRENTPLANLWTTMLQDAGAPVDRFADADGTATSVWA